MYTNISTITEEIKMARELRKITIYKRANQEYEKRNLYKIKDLVHNEKKELYLTKIYELQIEANSNLIYEVSKSCRDDILGNEIIESQLAGDLILARSSHKNDVFFRLV